MENTTNTTEKRVVRPCEKVVFTFTITSFLAACLLAIIVLWEKGSYETFLPISFFMSPIFWVVATAVTVWYIYEFGFPRAKNKKTSESGKAPLTILSMLVPLFIGFAVGLAAYYLIYWLSVALAASIGYILIAGIVIAAILGSMFLYKLFLKPKENKGNRKAFLFLSMLGAVTLLTLTILWMMDTMKTV